MKLLIVSGGHTGNTRFELVDGDRRGEVLDGVLSATWRISTDDEKNGRFAFANVILELEGVEVDVVGTTAAES